MRLCFFLGLVLLLSCREGGKGPSGGSVPLLSKDATKGADPEEGLKLEGDKLTPVNFSVSQDTACGTPVLKVAVSDYHPGTNYFELKTCDADKPTNCSEPVTFATETVQVPNLTKKTLVNMRSCVRSYRARVPDKRCPDFNGRVIEAGITSKNISDSLLGKLAADQNVTKSCGDFRAVLNDYYKANIKTMKPDLAQILNAHLAMVEDACGQLVLGYFPELAEEKLREGAEGSAPDTNVHIAVDAGTAGTKGNSDAGYGPTDSTEIIDEAPTNPDVTQDVTPRPKKKNHAVSYGVEAGAAGLLTLGILYLSYQKSKEVWSKEDEISSVLRSIGINERIPLSHVDELFRTRASFQQRWAMQLSTGDNNRFGVDDKLPVEQISKLYTIDEIGARGGIDKLKNKTVQELMIDPPATRMNEYLNGRGMDVHRQRLRQAGLDDEGIKAFLKGGELKPEVRTAISVKEGELKSLRWQGYLIDALAAVAGGLTGFLGTSSYYAAKAKLADTKSNDGVVEKLKAIVAAMKDARSDSVRYADLLQRCP